MLHWIPLLRLLSSPATWSCILVRIYPTGQKYSFELMFAKFATTKIANDLNPLKISPNRRYLPENNTEEF